MSKVLPHPRKCRYYGKPCFPVENNGTWLEAEEFCYPHGGMTRRAYVLFGDGTKRIVKCGIPDTFFTIPAVAIIAGERIKGFITSDEVGFKFN